MIDGVKTTLTIGKKSFEVIECEFKQSDLLFYEENPRVYSALRNIDSVVPSQKEIEEHMKNMDHVRQLKISIKSNGGLIDPLIVRDGDFVVLEGNSRLAAYRMLCEEDPITFGKVKCKVLPHDIDDSAIFTLLGQYHIVGRKDWDPYEQAGYLYRRRKESKSPIETIATELGISPSKAKKYIEVFEFMKEKNDLNPSRWSYYEECFKNCKIKNELVEDSELGNLIVEQIQSGEIQQAQDVRKIAKVISQKTKKGRKIINKIVEGKMDFYDGFQELEDSGSFDKSKERIKKFRDFVTDESFKSDILKSCEENNELRNEINFEIKLIIKKLVEVQRKLNDK